MPPSPSPSIVCQGSLIVGGGLAGLFLALQLAPYPVVLCTDMPIGTGGSTPWSQGGIAAAMGEQDSPGSHALDTIACGGGLVSKEVAELVASEGPACIEDCVKLDVAFDRLEDGRLALGQEGAHSRRRIVKAGGDQIGKSLMQALCERVRQTPSITRIEGKRACMLLRGESGHIAGIIAADTKTGTYETYAARNVVLATGGVGALYARTTNPAQSCGVGLSMAMQQGAMLENLELVQFHPTALLVNRDPMPLLSEALRGEGGHLLNQKGERFMQKEALGELSSRDVVAYQMAIQLEQGNQIFMDLRHVSRAMLEGFQNLHITCKSFGFDPSHDLLPTAPAAHYHMGGIRVDTYGRSSLPGLYACGEVASTGLHGANRLASNSLLEGLVFAKRAALCIKGNIDAQGGVPTLVTAPFLEALQQEKSAQQKDLQKPVASFREMMQAHVGILRHGQRLEEVIHQFTAWKEQTPRLHPFWAMLDVGTAIAACALARTETRGAHIRLEHPHAKDALCKSSLFSINSALKI